MALSSSSSVPARPPAQVAIEDGTFCVDTVILGELLALAPEEVPELMRTGTITSVCERGIDEHDGQYRLSFFHKNRRVRLSIDGSGRILRRTIVDFGERPLPQAMHTSGT